MAGIDTYRNTLRAPARGLWSGVLGHEQFIQMFNRAIEYGITNAFKEGSAECGIKPDEYTTEERAQLALFIAQQQGYVTPLADWIVSNRQSLGGKLTVIFTRIDKWLNAYREAVAKSSALACGDLKKKFVLGATEKHCRTCKGLNGRVYRNSVWVSNNAVPPNNRDYHCRGYNCLCRLENTTEPITRGRFPRGLLTR